MPVFVVGPSRSGKSVVESLLAHHPDVHGTGEHFQWATVLDQVRGRHDIMAPFPQCLDALAAEQIREMGAAYMADLARWPPGARAFVNTSPEHVLFLGLICEALPAAKIIFCRRDPLDNCLAIYFKRYEAANPFADDFLDIAAHYTAYQDLMMFWQGKFASRILPVKYEDMVADPQATAAKLFAFSALDGGTDAAGTGLDGGGIGHARHYADHLGPLRRALGIPDC